MGAGGGRDLNRKSDGRSSRGQVKVNIHQANRKVKCRVGGREVVPSVGVNGDACRGLFCDGRVVAGAFPPFLAGGQAVASGDVTRLLSGTSSGANGLLCVRRRCRADLRGVLHPSRINFRLEKVCRNEKNVIVAKTALAVQPGCGRRPFAVHAPVVSRFGSPLMFKYRPGVKSVVGLLGCVSFLFGGLCL